MRESDGAAPRRRFACVPWCSILLGCAAVWIASCVPGLAKLASERPQWVILPLAEIYFLSLFYTVFWKKKRDPRTLLGFLLAGGFLLRCAYVLTMPYTVSSHDLSFDFLDTDEIRHGHLGYIEYLYTFRHLPDFDPSTRMCYGNPPGFHILSAIVLGATKFLGAPEPLCYESLQIVPLFFANLTVLAIFRIFEEFSIKGKWLLLLTALISFHPYFLCASVTINNDAMMTGLSALAVLYTIRWWKKPTMRGILAIALSLGLAAFTKLNAATLSIGIGAVFLCALWRNRRDWRLILIQFCAFLAVCAPLGLFYPVRNALKFDMPLLYIQKLLPELNEWQAISNTSLLARLGMPNLLQSVRPFIRFDGATELNIWITTLRTSLFDEIRTGSALFVAASCALHWTNILLCGLMNLAFILCLTKRNTAHRELKIFLALAYAVMLAAYVKFCLSEPYICTMNYRYISLAMLFPCIGTGLCAQSYRGAPRGKLLSAGRFLLQYGIVHFAALSAFVSILLIQQI